MYHLINACPALIELRETLQACVNFYGFEIINDDFRIESYEIEILASLNHKTSISLFTVFALYIAFILKEKNKVNLPNRAGFLEYMVDNLEMFNNFKPGNFKIPIINI